MKSSLPARSETSSSTAMTVSRPKNAPFTIRDIPVRGRGETTSAMVIEPVTRMVIDRERLSRAGQSSTLSPVEEWMVAEVRQRGEGGRLLLFRAVREDGERAWEFDSTLTDAELERGGQVMTEALLPLHRALLRSGTILMVHTEWGHRESLAMRHGLKAVAEATERSASPTREVDLWIVRNMLMHLSLSIDHVVQSLLPTHLGLIERRVERVREILDGSPASGTIRSG